MAKDIYFFGKDGRYAALSNFAGSPFSLDGHDWRTMEHYFQAMKFEGSAQFERILGCGSPKQAKDLGQSRATPIRRDWDEVKEGIMLRGLRQKFQDPGLRALLLGTGKKRLVEDSPYDSYWGIGPNGKGKNRLGELLMQLRAGLAGSHDDDSAGHSG